MARILREDCVDLYRVIVTCEYGQRDFDTDEFEPYENPDGTARRLRYVYGPYDRKGTASCVASVVAPSGSPHSRLIEKRIQRLTAVAFETVKTDELGGRETKVSAELRWIDV